MDNHEFVTVAKRYAVDDVVERLMKNLNTPHHVHKPSQDGILEKSILQWLNNIAISEQERSNWFASLGEKDQKMVRGLLQECAKNAIASFFTLIDGVGEEYEGVFEIVAVDSSDRRNTINPQNSEMLHDIFYDVCAESRE